MHRHAVAILTVLLPGLAQALPVADASLCYRARLDHPAPQLPALAVVDRYAASTAALGVPDRLCGPAAYDAATPADDVTHLTQRRTRTAPGTPEPPSQLAKSLETPFGPLTVDLLHARWVGLPTRVDAFAEPPTPGADTANHLRCWSAGLTPGTAPLPATTTVEIDDAYGVRSRYQLGRLDRVCTPANIGGLDTIQHPGANLACFRVRPTRGQPSPMPPATLHSRDPLTSSVLRIRRVTSLCVPATLDLDACNGDPALCDRRYDQVSYPTTHNAMSNSDDAWVGPNQHHPVTQQLRDGVRGLMLDTHYDGGVAHLCHAYCVLGKKPLVDGLLEIRRYLDLYPNEVLSIIFESYISEADVAAAFAAAGLAQRVHIQSPNAAWPTLRSLLDRGRPLVVFTDVRGTLPWHHYVWDYASETPYSFAAPQDLSCAPNRGDPSNTLFILNHFLTQVFGNPTFAEQVNHNPLLIDRALNCQAVRQRVPNFVTVDFYDIGDLFPAVRTVNGL